MATTTDRVEAPARDGWVMVGMAVAAASAATASFTGLRGLAAVAGWPDRLAWLLPITIDAYAMTSARVWLAGTTHGRRARRFARANAVGAIAASIVGNAAYHMVSVGLLSVSWPIVVLVGAVPAAVLGLTAHLHALRTLSRSGETADRDGPATDPISRTEDGTENEQKDRTRYGTEDRTQDRTGNRAEDRTRPTDQSGTEYGVRTRTRPRARRRKARTEDALMAAARTADARYRATHDGRPITRDALRTALRIAGPKATELRAASPRNTPPKAHNHLNQQPSTTTGRRRTPADDTPTARTPTHPR